MTSKKAELIPIPECLPEKSPPRLALSKLSHIRSEMASIYRQGKTGKINLADATKLCYILQAIARLITDHELEQRIEALEAKQNEPKNKNSGIGSGTDFL